MKTNLNYLHLHLQAYMKSLVHKIHHDAHVKPRTREKQSQERSTSPSIRSNRLPCQHRDRGKETLTRLSVHFQLHLLFGLAMSHEMERDTQTKDHTQVLQQCTTAAVSSGAGSLNAEMLTHDRWATSWFIQCFCACDDTCRNSTRSNEESTAGAPC